MWGVHDAWWQRSECTNTRSRNGRIPQVHFTRDLEPSSLKKTVKVMATITELWYAKKTSKPAIALKWNSTYLLRSYSFYLKRVEGGAPVVYGWPEDMAGFVMPLPFPDAIHPNCSFVLFPPPSPTSARTPCFVSSTLPGTTCLVWAKETKSSKINSVSYIRLRLRHGISM